MNTADEIRQGRRQGRLLLKLQLFHYNYGPDVQRAASAADKIREFDAETTRLITEAVSD
jgi:hypothetical protein